jgi:DNA-binding beta-propeller fold protein YncE
MHIRYSRLNPIATVLTVLAFAFMPAFARAAVINATNMLGHVDVNGNPLYDVIALPATPQGFLTPISTCIDTVRHNLFVSTFSSVLVFPLSAGNQVSTRTASYILGRNDYLYASSPPADQKTMGFSSPGLACDSANGRLFVSDTSNNRVLVFDDASLSNGENASYVIGQADFSGSGATTAQNGLSAPGTPAYDPTNSRLFVPDKGNNRVLVFSVPTGTNLNGENADYVLGQADFVSAPAGTTATSMSAPSGAAYDPVNARLFVADTSNSRVTVFDVTAGNSLTGASASYAIGQSSLTGSAHSSLAAGIYQPTGAAYDAVNARLFVADKSNNRLTIYAVPTGSNLTNLSASYEIGQTAFNSSLSRQTKQSGLYGPGGVTFDSATNLLFVADSSNNRVMVFSAPTATNLTGIGATDMLGHLDTSGNPVYTAGEEYNNGNPNSAFNMHGIALDTKNHRMFVSDFSEPPQSESGRILVYPLDSDNKISSHNAVHVLGWKNFFTSNLYSSTASVFGTEVGVQSYDPDNERLFVIDANNNRVLSFNVDPATMTDGENATAVFGQASLTAHVAATSQSGLTNPRGAVYDRTNKRLFVADSGNNRVMVFNADPATMQSTSENASYVIGQADFSTGGAATTQARFSSIYSGYGGIAYQFLDYDDANSRIFVPDMGNNRVLVFNVPAGSNLNGENADYVLGQADFTSGAAALTQSGLNYPNGATYDPTYKRLFVSDYGGQRVMIFSVPTGTNLDGENAQNVLNQASFTDILNGAYSPHGSGGSQFGAYDASANRYFDAQFYPDRVMQFDMVKIATGTLPDGTTGSAYSQNIAITGQQGVSQSFSVIGGSLPAGLSLDAATGTISGTPTASGTSSFTIEADDNFATGPLFDRKSYTVAVAQGPAPSPTQTPTPSPTPTPTPLPTAPPATVMLGLSSVSGSGFLGNPTIPSRPTFSGTAPAGSVVTVTVHSDPVTCTATADSSGKWSCTLASALPPGSHTVTVSAVTPQGQALGLASFPVTVAPALAATGSPTAGLTLLGALLAALGLLGVAARRIWTTSD